MADIKSIIDATKRIESTLVDRFGATGRGLHEKLSSVERKVPSHLHRPIRSIASVRNKAVHEDGFEIPDPDQFLRDAERVAAELSTVEVPAGRPFPFGYVTGFLAVVGVGVMLLLLLGGADKPEPAAAPQATRPVVSESAVRADGRSPDPASAPAEVEAEAEDDADADADADAFVSAVLRGESRALSNEAVAVEQVSFKYAKGSFNRLEPSLTMRVRNTSSRTLSSIQMHARLYIEGSSEAIVATDDGKFFSRPLGLYFGDTGLAPGASVTKSVFFGLDAQAWQLPDAINATTRAVALRVIETNDGSRRAFAGEAAPFPSSLR